MTLKSADAPVVSLGATIAALAAALIACSGSPAPQDTGSTADPVKAAVPTPAQVLIDPGAVPQFVQDLPVLRLNDSTTQYPDYPGGLHTIVAGDSPLTLKMCEFQSEILPPAGSWKRAPPGLGATWVWGYVAVSDPSDPCPAVRDSYLGPVLAVTRGTPTEIRFVNALGSADKTNVIAYRTGLDQTLHWADPLNSMCGHSMGGMDRDPACDAPYAGPIAAVPHLHGGEVPPELDGGPDAWFTSTGKQGKGYYTRPAQDGAAATPGNEAVYRYPNTQEPGPAWFHDHTLGATRLNVYAGLAGAYVITDPAVLNPAIPPVSEIVPLVLQDRAFDTKGQLVMQAGMAGGTLWALNPEHPLWSPEFVGDPFDVIVVNGKAWPNLTVEPRRYRFLFINGSNSRTYEMFLADRVTKVVGPNLWVIGTDGGYMDRPELIDAVALKQKLVMMPGERYEVIVDFGALAQGTRLVLKNTAKTPYPGGATPQGATVAQLMQFTVGPCTSGRCGTGDTSYDPASGVAIRNSGHEMVKLVDFATGTSAVTPALVRQLTLNEVMGMPMAMDMPTSLYQQYFTTPLTSPFSVAFPGGPLEILLNNTKWDEDTSERPAEGSTEVWEIVNITADAHPIHLHLVQFQLLNRQVFDAGGYTTAYNASFPTPCMADPMNPGYCPGAGPPFSYDPGSDNRPLKSVPGITAASLPYVGGNPDVTPFLKGAAAPAAPQERGWKDTIMAPPGMVTRFVVRWAPTSTPAGETGAYPFEPASVENKQTYVWHCHIIDHEDNEMMRRSQVTPANVDHRDYVRNVHY